MEAAQLTLAQYLLEIHCTTKLVLFQVISRGRPTIQYEPFNDYSGPRGSCKSTKKHLVIIIAVPHKRILLHAPDILTMQRRKSVIIVWPCIYVSPTNVSNDLLLLDDAYLIVGSG